MNLRNRKLPSPQKIIVNRGSAVPSKSSAPPKSSALPKPDIQRGSSTLTTKDRDEKNKLLTATEEVPSNSTLLTIKIVDEKDKLLATVDSIPKDQRVDTLIDGAFTRALKKVSYPFSKETHHLTIGKVQIAMAGEKSIGDLVKKNECDVIKVRTGKKNYVSGIYGEELTIKIVDEKDKLLATIDSIPKDQMVGTFIDGAFTRALNKVSYPFSKETHHLTIGKVQIAMASEKSIGDLVKKNECDVIKVRTGNEEYKGGIYVEDYDDLVDAKKYFVPLEEVEKTKTFSESNKTFRVYVIYKKPDGVKKLKNPKKNKKTNRGSVYKVKKLLRLVVDVGTSERSDYTKRVAVKANRFPPEKYGHFLLVECSAEAARDEGWPAPPVMAYGYEITTGCVFKRLFSLHQKSHPSGPPDKYYRRMCLLFAKEIIDIDRLFEHLVDSLKKAVRECLLE